MKAIKCKKEQQLYAAFSLRGTIYVKKRESDSPKRVSNWEELTDIMNPESLNCSFRNPGDNNL